MDTKTKKTPNGKPASIKPNGGAKDAQTDYSEFEALLARVGYGKENAYYVSGNHNGKTARAMRRAVSFANSHGDIIVNDMDGEGYYRPILSRPEERASVHKYVATLMANVETMLDTVIAIQHTIREDTNGRH